MGIIERVTHIQQNHPYLTVTLFLLLTALLLPGMARVETIVALENMMPATAESVKTANQLRDQGLNFDTFAVKIETTNHEDAPTTVTTPPVQRYTTYLTDELREIRGVANVQNPLTNTRLITQDRQISVIPMQGYQGDDGNEIQRVFTEIQQVTPYNKPQGIQTSIVGVPAVQQRLSQIVNTDTLTTGILSLLLVFALTLILFNGSLNAAILPLFVVGLSVVWLYGTMGYLGIPLSTLAGSVAALVIGIGVDYSIHILNTYRYHRKDRPVTHSLDEAVGETGVAIMVTSITTISAFLSFLVGSMPEMHRFGIIMSLGILYALILSFLFLPALFVIEEDLMQYVKHRFTRRHQE